MNWMANWYCLCDECNDVGGVDITKREAKQLAKEAGFKKVDKYFLCETCQEIGEYRTRVK